MLQLRLAPWNQPRLLWAIAALLEMVFRNMPGKIAGLVEHAADGDFIFPRQEIEDEAAGRLHPGGRSVSAEQGDNAWVGSEDCVSRSMMFCNDGWLLRGRARRDR